jgi:hypothetical protein
MHVNKCWQIFLNMKLNKNIALCCTDHSLSVYSVLLIRLFWSFNICVAMSHSAHLLHCSYDMFQPISGISLSSYYREH